MRFAITLTIVLAAASSASAADWLMMPSTYSHHPVTGQRVSQFRETPRPEATSAPNFRSSGYTHYRSSVNYGQSADNYHRVDTWGGDVRPYGEWRFPYRPYSTPYQNWGAPFGGLNIGVLPGAGYFPGAGYYPPAAGGGVPPNSGAGGAQGNVGGNVHVPGQNPLLPYQVSPGNSYPRSPYPVPPHYDGYHPVYPQ